MVVKLWTLKPLLKVTCSFVCILYTYLPGCEIKKVWSQFIYFHDNGVHLIFLVPANALYNPELIFVRITQD